MIKLDAKKVLQAIRFAGKDVKGGNTVAAEAQLRWALVAITSFNRGREATISIS